MTFKNSCKLTNVNDRSAKPTMLANINDRNAKPTMLLKINYIMVKPAIINLKIRCSIYLNLLHPCDH